MTLKFLLILCVCFTVALSAEISKDKKREKNDSRQLEYISLINTLLQQTNVLSSVDGVLLAVTTVLASLVTRMKPFLIASTLSYLIYVAMAIFVPGPLAQFGLPTMDSASGPQFMARSVEGGGFSEALRLFDNPISDAVMKSITISPAMSVMTNISVNVITDTMTRLRMISRVMVQQLSMFQSNMVWFSRVMSNECVSRFLCRVGQFTEVNFPLASSMLRRLADSYPGMDDYAVAIVRGTSSSNCSLIYPDCTV